MTLLKYHDVPGMIGKLGTTFGHHGAEHRGSRRSATGRTTSPTTSDAQAEAVMAVTTDQPVPRDVLDEIIAEEGFVAARFVSLAGTLG